MNVEIVWLIGAPPSNHHTCTYFVLRIMPSKRFRKYPKCRDGIAKTISYVKILAEYCVNLITCYESVVFYSIICDSDIVLQLEVASYIDQ